MLLKRHLTYCALALAAVLNSGSLRAADGPTPFPPKDSPDWPGRGVIRVFPWMVDNRNYFWTKRGEAQNSIAFIGDSLTGNWGNLGKAFPKVYIANRGIGGDVTRGVLFRFQEDVLDLHPKAIVILIGANDLSAKEPTADALANIGDMLDKVQKEAPGTPVILCTTPPRDSKEAPVDISQSKELNAGIVKLAEGRQNVTLLDLFPLFVLPGTDQPDPQYFKPDKLHFGNPGYDKWKAALETIFTNLKLM